MKIIIKNEKIITFLNKKEVNKITFKDEEKLEDYFKTFFIKLNKIYNMDINGYYNIDIYLDENYGAILEIKNEDLDYYNYFNQIDMKLNILKTTPFLYEIKYEFLDKNILENATCYKKTDRIYLKINKEIEDCSFFKLLEFADVIYGKEVDNILKYGEKVRI